VHERRGALTFSSVVIFLPLSSAADMASRDWRGFRRMGPLTFGGRGVVDEFVTGAGDDWAEAGAAGVDAGVAVEETDSVD